MNYEAKKYDEKKEKKKWKTVRIIGGCVILTLGAVFGIVAIYLNNWNIIRFITDYRVLLVLIVTVAIAIFLFSFKEVK